MADDVSTEQITTEANGKERRTKITKRKWNKKEDEVLVAALLELCDAGWKRDNNIFRSGYTSVLEKELKSKLPGRNLKASPHIESRLKTLKKHCDAITDMRGARGIHWNKEEHTVICEDDDIWEDWVKVKLCNTFLVLHYTFFLPHDFIIPDESSYFCYYF